MHLLERYKHIAVIGDGYFSLVKKYQSLDNGQYYAVKELKKEFITNTDYIHRFRREIELLKSLSGHPNIIDLIDYQTDESTNLYIMPLAATNLYDYIKRNNDSIGVDERITIFDQILSAIKYAHSLDILHRDIYPNNVLLFQSTGGYVVKLSDFGLGKNLESASAFTRTAVASYGNIYYAAPEQRESLKNASFKSDVYSLGKILNFVMTGKDPDKLYPCDFTTVIVRATESDPASRYNDILDFEKIYEQIKALVGPDSSVDDSISYVVTSDGKSSYDWIAFHKFAVKGEYQHHVYDDYIQPVVSVLSDQSNLEKYYAEIGNAIDEFLAVFIDNLHVCYGMTRWPFSAMGSFGNLLARIYNLISGMRGKILCLTELWSIAYEQDQWSVQPIMNGLLNDSDIPVELQTEFAMVILKSSAIVEPERFERLRLPVPIRRAIFKRAKPIE